MSECVICYDPFDSLENFSVLSCGHCFHCTCIEKWAQYKTPTTRTRPTPQTPTCPQCRIPFTLTPTPRDIVKKLLVAGLTLVKPEELNTLRESSDRVAEFQARAYQAENALRIEQSSNEALRATVDTVQQQKSSISELLTKKQQALSQFARENKSLKDENERKEKRYLDLVKTSAETERFLRRTVDGLKVSSTIRPSG